jgi:DNA-binding NtrC family response regulator
MESKNILMVERPSDEPVSLNFLLHIAGNKVAVVRDTAEAINWISSHSETETRTDLLLVNNWGVEGEISEMILRVRKDHPILPIVIVDRGYRFRTALAQLINEQNVVYLGVAEPFFILRKMEALLAG